MTRFLKLLRLKNLLVLALALISTPVFACFFLPQQPPQPVFSKQGSTTLATYTVTGNVGNIIGTTQCTVTDVSTINIPVVTAFGYTYKSADFFVTNVKSLSSNCTASIVNRRAAFTRPTIATVCSVSFNMVYPLTGSYNGSNPSSDFIYRPKIFFSFGTAGGTLEVTNPIPIPSEPARTCSLTQPGIVTMADRKPSDFPNVASVSRAGSFSVTLSCPPTTSARSGTPSLIFSYPTTFVAFTCSATNQADPAFASPVLAVITRLSDNTLVCGTSANSSSVQNFASFNGTGAYTSTLDFNTSYISQKANPGPGVFTASITLQVQYP
jgi:hypothetical protein